MGDDNLLQLYRDGLLSIDIKVNRHQPQGFVDSTFGTYGQIDTYVYIYFFICTLENYNFIDILVINI